jgi:hypothetical protein
VRKEQGDELRNVVLEAMEHSLEAQLRAVRRLRKGSSELPEERPARGRSQVDLVEDILRRADAPLHITEILEKIAQLHKVDLDRESVVSALTKKIRRGERFERSGPNVFALKSGGQ